MQVLLGNYPVQRFSATPSPRLRIDGLIASPLLRDAKLATVTIARIPNSEEAPLAAVVPVSMATIPVIGGSVDVALPEIGLHEGLVVNVR